MRTIQESLTNLRGLYQKEEIEKSSSGYQIHETLGKGNFGQVRRALHIDTQVPVAIKILNKSKIVENNDLERVKREIEILAKIDHPNVAYLYEIVDEYDYYFIVLEYCSKGTLGKLLSDEGRFIEPQACKYFWEILSATQHLHSLGIVHRDLKPENILLDDRSVAKIVDFGLGNIYQQRERLKTPCGSPCYAPPEVDFSFIRWSLARSMILKRPIFGVQE